MSQKLTKFHNETYGKVFYMSQTTRVRDIYNVRAHVSFYRKRYNVLFEIVTNSM